MNVRPSIKTLYDLCRQPLPVTDGGNSITVSAAMRRVAFAYERFRNTLEPDEEDVLRRKAIARILDRRLADNHSDSATAIALLQEMIRGNYIKGVNNETLQRIIQEITNLRLVSAKVPAGIQDWFMRVGAVSIDRELYPKFREEYLVQLFYYDAYRRTVWTDELVAEEDRPAQLYVACHRALFAADNYEISYHYFINYLPDWKKKLVTEADAVTIAREISSFFPKIEKILTHPARQRLTYLLRRPAVPYRVLRDVFQSTESDPLASADVLEKAVVSSMNDRQKKLKDRMTRRANHSILFLLCTKTILTLLIELPYELFLLKQFYLLPFATNIFFHPLLLFVFSTSVRFPGAENTKAVVEKINNLVTDDGDGETIVVNAPRHYGSVTWAGFAIFYAVLFMSIFWGLFTLLDYFHFSLVAIALFIIFLGLVSFLAVRIRRSADETRMVAKREGTVSIMGSFLALPVLEFGSWLAQNISQVNIILFLMDRILEAPFKLFIDITEEWFVFVRDRREEIL